MTSLVIDARHNGPPGSGNGGWTSGLVAGVIGATGPVEVTLRKHKLRCEVKDFTPYAARTEGYTGSDIELAVTTAWRFAVREGATALADAHLAAALDDLLPTARDQRTIDRMTLLALDECRNKRVLPRNHEEIRRAIVARLEA